MSSIKTSTQVEKLAENSFTAKLIIQRGQLKKEVIKNGRTKGEAIMAIMALPEYKAKPAIFAL